MRLLIVAAALLLLLGCGDDVLVTAAPPSPSPTPDPCKILRADITASVKGAPAYAWGLGQVATLTLTPTFESDDLTLTEGCAQWNVVTWAMLHTGDPLCMTQGNLTAKSVRLVCLTSGWGLIEAAPQGYDEFRAQFRFRVLEPEA